MNLPPDYVPPRKHYCSRRTVRTGRPCQREAAEWPSGYDDLPVQVACRSHLTDEEWALCLEARKRHNAEQRDNHLTWVEREALAELLPPVEPVELRPCTGQCAFERWPGSPAWDDLAPFHCTNCDSAVCYNCGQARVEHDGGMCSPCEARAYGGDAAHQGDYIDLDPDQVDHGPDPRGRLNRLVNEIASATGDSHREVNARINREVGVRSRVGADEQTIRRASGVAADWLSKVTAKRAEV